MPAKESVNQESDSDQEVVEVIVAGFTQTTIITDGNNPDIFIIYFIY